MTRTHSLSATSALIVCLVGTHLSGTLFASAEETSSKEAPSSTLVAQATTATRTATSAGIGISIEPQPIKATDRSAVPPPTPERTRFTLTDEGLAASASSGADSRQAWRNTFNFIPAESTSLAQRGGYRGRGSRGGRDGSATAIILGAAATIAGTAVLVYANRPECSTNQAANGCGYGTRVIGGAVLAGGIVGLVVGAASWR
jgi:hypothetical protein